MFKDLGATRQVETWGDDIPDGKVTDFKGVVKAKPDEVVVFSWLEYPDKATRDQANEKIMSDPTMKDMANHALRRAAHDLRWLSSRPPITARRTRSLCRRVLHRGADGQQGRL